jgi:hypothetical protein
MHLVESVPMNDSPSKPSLLESLRERSDAVRNADKATRRPLGVELKEIDRRLLAAFRRLDEALGHLEVIRPLVGHRFTIDPSSPSESRATTAASCPIDETNIWAWTSSIALSSSIAWPAIPRSG